MEYKKVDLCVKIFKLFLYHIVVLAGGQSFYIWNGKEVEHLCLHCIKFSKEKVATKRWEKFGSKLGIVLYIFCRCVFALSINCLRFLKEKARNFNSKLRTQICFRLRWFDTIIGLVNMHQIFSKNLKKVFYLHFGIF